MTKDTVSNSTVPQCESKAAELTRERLAPIVEGVPEEERGAAEALSDELVFMAGTMATLKQFVADHGVVAVDGRTGAPKESPAVRSYNAMVPRYASICKQLCKMSEDGANQVDPLLEFINGGDDDGDEN